MKRILLTVLPDTLLKQLKKFRYARALKTFDEPDMSVVKHLVRRGDSVIDIGANVGWYTKVLSELVGERGLVQSIEPIPPTFELLSYCVGKLSLGNVRLLSCAVSSDNGTACMEVPHYETGGENYYQSKLIVHRNESSLRQFRVPTRSLDSIAADAPATIAFVKCDVEGHELFVIKGAARVLGYAKPSWLIEISQDPDAPSSESHALICSMKEHGYGVYWFDGRELRTRQPGDHSVNYFFLTKRHLESLISVGVMVRA
jgi:FkbM family methyltransferase